METNDDATFTIGEVAETVGMSVHALRYYEREQLLIGPIRRSSGGRRQYDAVDVDWLRICTRLRESGMPLSELRRFAELIRDGEGNETERLRLLDAHRTRVEAQIAALEQAHEIIAWKTYVYKRHLRAGVAGGLWAPSASPNSPTI